MLRTCVVAIATTGLCFACMNVVDSPSEGEGEGEGGEPVDVDDKPDDPADDDLDDNDGDPSPPVDAPDPSVDTPDPPPPTEEAAGYVPPDLVACEGGPLESPLPNCAPSLPPSTGDPHRDCVDRINQLRWECQCLNPLARWTDGEACADEMAKQDHDSNTAHGAAGGNICDWGFGQNECPGWGDAEQCIEGCLQMMWDEGPGPFFDGHGHYINMTTSNHSQVACGFYEGNNGAWSVQNFR